MNKTSVLITNPDAALQEAWDTGVELGPFGHEY
jgi:hypothetical protein